MNDDIKQRLKRITDLEKRVFNLENPQVMVLGDEGE